MQAEANKAGMPAQPISDCALDAELLSYIFERSNNIARYSDKLSKSIEQIDQYFKKVGPISGIRYIESRTFYTDDEDDYHRFYSLAVETTDSGNWGLKVATFDSEELNAEWTSLKSVTWQSRFIKKQVIQALPQFMKSYAAELEKYEKEYQDISEKAERMAAIISPGADDSEPRSHCVANSVANKERI